MRIPPPPQPLSVVIPTHDTRELTLAAVDSVISHGPPGTEIIVVDDGSSDGTSEQLDQQRPEVTVIRTEKATGFSASANRGMARAQGKILLLLNSDAILTPGSLSPMFEAFENDDQLGIAGATLKYPDGSPQWSGGAFPTLPWLFALTSGVAVLAGSMPLYRRIKGPGQVADGAVQWVTGAAMAVRRKIWDDLGPLDEGYRFYGQDLDLCRKASDAGWRVALIPDFIVTHYHGATIGSTDDTPDIANFEHLWADILRYVDRYDGVRAARRARRVMLAGVTLRLCAMAVATPFASKGRREALKNRKAHYRRAAKALTTATPNQGA